MDTEKIEHTNGQDNLSQEEKKPIIDQMTDLAAQSAGALAETAVKVVVKKAKKAAAKRLPRSVKKAANTIAKATTTNPAYLRVEPVFRSLRDDPRFQKITKAAGIP